ncbi:MAG: metabolite traffic protein EboE, partial [Methylobacter sp.]
AFHGSRIKDAVYRPDWREPARLDYSNRLAEVLAALLPEGMDGSISSVPGAYQAHLSDAGDMARMVEQLVQHAVHLHRLHETTGRVISMALEPEPGCLLETSGDAVAFFTWHLFAKAATQQTVALTGLDEAAAQALLHRHLGLCLDACHAAVAFEEPAACLAKLRQANIPIHKVQLSAGLCVAPPGPEQRAALAPFAEDVYLHQVVARSRQGLKRYADLPEALADDSTADEWRIHYHVPIWAERMGAFATTRPWLEALLDLHRQSPICAHWEVETYTWSVLPESLRPGSVDAAIAQELQWAKERLI